MLNLQRNAMKAIKMQRKELLNIVQDNKTKHIKEFNEAVEDYKSLVLQIATENVKLAKSGNLTEFNKMREHPNPPISYEDNYKRAIRMLELSIDDVIEVAEDVFNQLVLDEWHWTHNFITSNAMYKSASAALGGAVGSSF